MNYIEKEHREQMLTLWRRCGYLVGCSYTFCQESVTPHISIMWLDQFE